MADTINHPQHYQGKIECIEYLEAHFMDRPHEWNAVKYLSRANRKDNEIEDLKKAIWYIKRKIELLESNEQERNPVRPNEMDNSYIELPKGLQVAGLGLGKGDRP